MIEHLVNVSGGAASGLSLIRVVERFGKALVSARFADTKCEADDVYAFIAELERYTGVPITRLDQGVSTYELFEQRGMWTDPQNGGCVASYHLKRLPLRAHAELIGFKDYTTIYVGFGPDEDDRMKRLIEAGKPWKFDFPLNWKPKLGRCDVLDELRGRGLHPPDAYERGYEHANCRQKCVLAGISQWQKLSIEDPATFAEAEDHEQRMLAMMRERGRKETTILRDRRGGEINNLSLTQLRTDTASGRRPIDTRSEMASCSCVGLLW